MNRVHRVMSFLFKIILIRMRGIGVREFISYYNCACFRLNFIENLP